MSTTRALLAVAGLLGGIAVLPVSAAEGTQPPRLPWTFSGVTGKFDRAQLQRGFKVYREVCQACHQLKIPFRTLAQPGGPQFSSAQVAALAAEYKIPDGPNDAGEMFERPGRAADFIPWTFANENAAASAMGGKAPPPLTIMAKARSYERGFPWFVFDTLPFLTYQEHGVDYMHALLTGYVDKPADIEVPDGGYYNAYYPGHVIAMPKPLIDGQLEYPKGPDGKSPVPETVDQYAKDVAAFMMWAAEPTLEQRKRTGFMVLIFLAVMGAGLGYWKKKVWANVGHGSDGMPGSLPAGRAG